MAERIKLGFNDPKWDGIVQCLGVWEDNDPFGKGPGDILGCGATFRIERDDLHVCDDSNGQIRRRLCFACRDCGVHTEYSEELCRYFQDILHVEAWHDAHPDVPRRPVALTAHIEAEKAFAPAKT